MKNLLNAVIAAIAFALLCFAPLAMAQTPDGATPAEETVCDPLKEDGVTKGLYGLCVAFCEAQDHADASVSITPEELEALESDAPSGKILANYNKKKDKANNSADPEMPCIVVQEPCPCWSADELASIDGYDTNGVSINLRCAGSGMGTTRRIHEFQPNNLATAWNTNRRQQCDYRNQQVTPQIFRRLSVRQGTLTTDQAQECLSQVNAACAAAGFN